MISLLTIPYYTVGTVQFLRFIAKIKTKTFFSHEKESDEFVEKIKSAYQLMGLMYDLENTKKIRKASVWYKKRFSQIRFQNRILRLQKPVNKHIYFDDDDDVINEPTQVSRKDRTNCIKDNQLI